MLYKLTKGTLSRIRKDLKGIKDLEKDGYKFIGEVDKDYNIINIKRPFAPKKKGK